MNDFDRSKWIYIPDYYTDYRYILGTKGENPLICIGINPSTAEPDNLDNTLKSVDRISFGNGFDSFIMFNVYAQRATDPNDMHIIPDMDLHRANMAEFDRLLSEVKKPALWAAWGTIIEKRPYLKDMVKEMIEIGIKYDATWYSVGKCSKKGHPHHPLYLRKDEKVMPFDIKSYISGL